MATTDQTELLAMRVRELAKENQELRDRLESIERREEAASKARARLMRGGFRLMIPLLDRQRVVRSFGQLAETAGEFTGPASKWPPREKVLADAREFMESVVRFMIRRRLFLLFISLLAGAIPLLQVWLVFQQNEIIESQNDLFEIQVYDVVARSMTEGDRNARLVTGALLANAELSFLENVVEEAFDPGLAAVYRAEGVQAATRRLEDAAFRGHLVRSVARAVHRRAGEPPDPLLAEVQPTMRAVLRDAESRVPEVLRLGRPPEADAIDGALAEQVDNYLAQIGALMQVYGRLARSAGEERAFYLELRPLLARIAGRRDIAESRFGPTLQTVMQDFLFEVATAPEIGAPPVDLASAGLSPAQAVTRGLSRLREVLGESALPWQNLEEQVRPR